MRVQIVCDYFPPGSRAGGPIRSLAGLAATEAKRNDVDVVTRDRDLGCDEPYSSEELARYEAPQAVTVHRVEPGVPAVVRALRRQGPVDVRVLNSVWSVPYGFVPLVMARTGILRQKLLIVAPHGELAPSALSVKVSKKRPFLPLLRALLDAGGVVFHASSEHEAQHIRAFLKGREPRIVTEEALGPTPDACVDVPAPHSDVRLVCVGRLAPVKNVELAIKAVAAVPSARLDLIGPLQDESYVSTCRKLVGQFGVDDRVRFLGHSEPQEVLAALRGADAMISPTRGENFGYAIAEALSVGCPVMVPDTTLWTDLVRDSGGWVIDTDDPGPAIAAIERLGVEDTGARSRRRESTRLAYARWWSAEAEREPLSLLALRMRESE